MLERSHSVINGDAEVKAALTENLEIFVISEVVEEHFNENGYAETKVNKETLHQAKVDEKDVMMTDCAMNDKCSEEAVVVVDCEALDDVDIRIISL